MQRCDEDQSATIAHAGLVTDSKGGSDNTVSGSTVGITAQRTVFERNVPGCKFTGYFVGDSGNEVFGTWIVGTLLPGVFGASRQSTSRVTLPPVPYSSGLTVTHDDIPSELSYDSSAGTIQIPDAVAEFSDDPNEVDDVFKLSDLYSRTTMRGHRDRPSGAETECHTLSVRLRRTSHTRFRGMGTHNCRRGAGRDGKLRLKQSRSLDDHGRQLPMECRIHVQMAHRGGYQ